MSKFKYNSEKLDSCLNTFRETFSNPEIDKFKGSVILPLDFSLEMDGISGLIPHSAFEIPTNSLPSNYLTKKGESKIAFILHTIDHNFNNNKWTTKITGQTLNIRFDELTEEQKKILLKSKSTQSPNTASPPFIDDTPVNIRGPIPPSQEFWTLVAICAREDKDDQSRADIAQSIYNRLGSGAYSGRNITTLITNRFQYEPTWRYPNGPQRGIGNANKEWFEITDINSASKATGLPISELQKTSRAIKSEQLQINARNFIEGRTDFLGVGQPAKAMTNNNSKKQRTLNNNQFGFSYNYTKNVIYPIPEVIKNFSII